MTTIFKVIKNEEDYNAALQAVEELISKDPEPDTDDSDKLDLLTSLIEDYESKKFPETLPDPIEAIKFRIEQLGLKNKYLEKFIGSKSKVSEVLSKKRPLSLTMIRNLEKGLGIPAKVLIQESEQTQESLYKNWDSSIINAMKARDYFGEITSKNNKLKLLKDFFSVNNIQVQQMATLYRKTNFRSSPLTDRMVLAAWKTQVLNKAKKIKVTSKYKPDTINLEYMRNLVKLSVIDNSPVLAQDQLKKIGIKLIIEPHLPKTNLDGAAIMSEKGNPVIGLTLRYDRLDNFWFTLMHELAHIALHYDNDIDLFYDELETVKGSESGKEEEDADKLAGEALVPSEKWEISPAKLVPSALAANSLAKELGIHIAIVAGKIRYEGGNWAYLNNVINEKVRDCFPAVVWKN